MELKIPPALTAVICGALMWLINEMIHPAWILFDLPVVIYKTVLLVAVVIGATALLQFIRHRTTVDPHRPDKADSLVHDGLYRFTRNPMYLALLIALIAFGFKLGNLLAFLIIPAFVWYMNRFQIKPEEKILQEKFGREYTEYKQNVRRWI